jgi:hypothetical protein
MGFPYNKLVAPAVLFSNPNITKEEYVELLNQTHSSCFRQYSPNDQMDYYDPRMDDNYYHGGLAGLAGLLRLKKTDEYVKFQAPTSDENNLLIRPPLMLPAWEEDNHAYEVSIHEKNIVESPRVVEEISCEKLEAGSIWECMMGSERGIVTKIIDEKYIGREEKSDWDDVGPDYEYRMEIRRFYGEGKTEKFDTQEDLWEKWPQFHPDFVYDWKQKEGNFSGLDGVDKFLWVNDDGKYSLDSKTFDVIPAGGGGLTMGYTDLILTAEAIRNNAWKVLSYLGSMHLEEFLDTFPESRAIYDRAVWDSHTSLYAKEQQLSISDFLRSRISKFMA